MMNEKTIDCYLSLSDEDFIMQNHHVHGVSLMPGVTFFDIVMRILEAKGFDYSRAIISNTIFFEPIATELNADKDIHIVMDKVTENSYHIRGQSRLSEGSGGSAGDEWKTNFTATLKLNEKIDYPSFDIQKLKASAQRIRSNSEVYGIARRENIVHGELMTSFGTMYQGESYLLGELNLSAYAQEFDDDFIIHPARLDGSTLLAYAWSEFDPGQPFIPIYVGQFSIREKVGEQCYIYVPEEEVLAPSGDVIYNDYYLLNGQGQAVALLKKLVCKRIRHENLIQKLKLEPESTGDHEAVVVGGALDSGPVEGQSDLVSHQSLSVKEVLTSMVAGILEVPADGINTRSGFYDLGLDSSNLLQLGESLEDFIKFPIYPTLLFEYTNIDTLTDYLLIKFGDQLNTKEYHPEENIKGDTLQTTTKEAAGWQTIVKNSVSECLSQPFEQINADKGFYELGLQSTDLLHISQRLEEFAGQPLYPTLLFEYANINTLVSYLDSAYPNIEKTTIVSTDSGPEASVADDAVGLMAFHSVWQKRPLLDNSGSSIHSLVLKFGHVQNRVAVSLQEAGLESVEYQGEINDLTSWFHSTLNSKRLSKNLILLFDCCYTATKVLLACQSLAAFLTAQRQTKNKRVLVISQHDQNFLLPITEAISAFGRTVQKETPGIKLATLTLDDQVQDGEIVPYIHGEFDQPEDSFEAAVRYSRHERQVRRYQSEQIPGGQNLGNDISTLTAGVHNAFKNKGVYLITGGCGGVGQLLCQYLAANYQARIMILGRRQKSSLPSHHTELWQKASNLGGEVAYCQADIQDAAAVKNAVQLTREKWGKINGVLHCAGVIADGLHFLKKNESIEQVLGAKISGLVNLDLATENDELDVLMACSSLSAQMANIGQSDYAYANAYVEAYCQERQQRCAGLSVAIGWPYWAEGGMRVDDKVLEQSKKQTGMYALPSAVGINGMEYCLAKHWPAVTLVYGDKSRLSDLFQLPEEPTSGPAAKTSEETKVTKNQHSHQSVHENRQASQEAIAIIGLAGQYPEAKNLSEFWQNLKNARNSITKVLESRWQHSHWYKPERGAPGKTYGQWGGFLDRIEYFDASFFGLSRKEAELMDPQERLFLRSCWEAMESAAITPDDLNGMSVGVFAGVMWNHYQQLTSPAESSTPTAIHASVANRVSYCLNLTGPSMTVDTMCSSSLTALHLAVESLRRGECEQAFAGGVNIQTHPKKYLQLADNQFLSDDGLCRSFGADGTGYVPGEGVGVALLKPLAQAEKDGNQILAVIRASSLNHSGKTSGFTVPSPTAQASLLKQALKNGNIQPDSISYIEAHGTGTSLGDPIEIAGITQAYGAVANRDGDTVDSNKGKTSQNRDKPACAIGSVKSNIGHLESAAGIAGVTKVILQMQHKTLVPSLHAENPNPYIDFDRAPVHLQKELEEWATNSLQPQRRAGVSAFGAGGSNVHLIIDEYQQPINQQKYEVGAGVIIPLSARTLPALKAYAGHLKEWLENNQPSQLHKNISESGRSIDAVEPNLVHKQSVLKLLNEKIGAVTDDLLNETFEDLGVDPIQLIQLQDALRQQQIISQTTDLRPDDTPESVMQRSISNFPEKSWLASLAYVLQTGRDEMPVRFAVMVASYKELLNCLSEFVSGKQTPENSWWPEEADESPKVSVPESGHMFSYSKEQLNQLAQYWQQGGEVKWHNYYGANPDASLSSAPSSSSNALPVYSLPTYPFEEKPYWLGRWKSIKQGLLTEESPLISLEESVTTKNVVTDKKMSAEQVFNDTVSGDDVAALINQVLSELLYIEQGEINPELSFNDMGLESTGALTLIEKINKTFKTSLEPVVIYDYSSVNQLVEKVLVHNPVAETAPSVLSQAKKFERISVEQEEQNSLEGLTNTNKVQPIAVIGMSGRFADAPNLDSFWNNLASGHSSIKPVAESRWPAASYYDPEGKDNSKIQTRWAAMLDEVDQFDPSVFQISPVIAELMDPQQRMFLEESWHALEDAGYAVRQQEKQPVGVFVGCAVGDYLEWLMASGKGNSGEAFLGLVPSILASRISYFLNFNGPAIAVDTACSSSLVSIHMACDSIRNGDCEMAVAGGVALMLTPQLQVRSAKMGILSNDGKCSPFDASANGTVLGEGVGAVVLKSLDKAIADGDHIHGVIHASGVNNDGKSNGITAPSGESQELLIRQVMERAALQPSDIGYIEAHGTGTDLGDPIEVNALKQIHLASGGDTQYKVGIGSVKSNIGHTTMTAGIAGMFKSLLAIQHEQIPQSLNYSTTNSKIDLSHSPIYVVDKLTPWQANENGERISSVSSFGFSGTNCHLLIGNAPVEPQTQTIDVAPPQPVLVTLSGNTPTALNKRVSDLRDWLNKNQTASLANIAFSLAQGRSHFRHRYALVAENITELAMALEQWSGQGNLVEPASSSLEQVYEQLNDSLPATELLKKLLHQLALHYQAGSSLVWKKIPGLAQGHRISLPVYPFTKQSLWLDVQPEIFKTDSSPAQISDSIAAISSGPAASDNRAAEGRADKSESLISNKNLSSSTMTNSIGHPLIDSQQTNNNKLISKGELSSCRWLLDHHIVNHEPVLPGVVSLEMAVAAERLRGVTGPLSLSRVRWLKPFMGKHESSLVLTINEQAQQFSELREFSLLPSQGQGSYVTGRITKLPPAQNKPEAQNLGAIKQNCSQNIGRADIYSAFSDSGIAYGAGFSNLQSIVYGTDEALGEIALSSQIEQGYFIHPGILDSAFQVISVLQNGSDHGPAVPFSLDQFVFYRSPESASCFAYVKKSGNLSYNIDVLDERGQLCVRCTGFSLRAIGNTEKMLTSEQQHTSGQQGSGNEITFVADWVQQVTLPECHSDDRKVAVVAPERENSLALSLKACHKFAQVELFSFRDKLPDTSDFDSVYFIAGSADGEQEIIQDATALSAFRSVKSLLNNDQRRKPLTIKFISQQTLKVIEQDQVNPYGAGLVGFAQALAAEYPHWKVTAIDIDHLSMADVAGTAVAIYNEPTESGLLAIRNSKRYRRRFIPKPMTSKPGSTSFDENGVYLVVGGTGGLGFELSQYLAKTASATLIWVGRRRLDASISQKQQTISGLGGKAHYIQANITDDISIQQQLDRLRALIGKPVDGVIHAGGVFADMSLAKMDEDNFIKVIKPKHNGVMSLQRVFKNQPPLKFMLLFSTAASFVESAGQANYAAASTIEDALAFYLDQTEAYPVKVVNWGYWGSVGAVSGEQYKKRMADIGLWSIETDEAMQSLEKIFTGLNSHAALQTLVIKAEPIRLKEWLGIVANEEEPDDLATLVKSRDGYQLLETVGQSLMAEQMLRNGLLPEPGERTLSTAIKSKVSPQRHTEKLMDALFEMAHRSGWIKQTGDQLEGIKQFGNGQLLKAQLIEKFPDLSAHVSLLTACIDALPDVLTGKRLGTDVLFPKGSVELVQGVYRGQPIANYYNQIVASKVKARVEKINKEEKRKARVLEVGAGTGGTSTFVLPALTNTDVEYCYTDISPAFLHHGQQHYLPDYPFMKFNLLNMEQPIADQGFDAGSYDVVLGTMVLHVAKDIQKGMDNVGQLLAKGGCVVINEVTQQYDFLTLTFGLLEDWWAFADSERRVPHAPMLNPDQWTSTLSSIGFSSVDIAGIPATPARLLEQCIIMADYQREKKQAVGVAPVINTATDSHLVAAPSLTTPSVTAPGNQAVVQYLKSIFADVLKYDPSALDEQATFEQFGVDSLVGQRVTAQLENDFGELPATLLFEYMTLTSLADFFITQKSSEVASLLGGKSAGAETAPAPMLTDKVQAVAVSPVVYQVQSTQVGQGGLTVDQTLQYLRSVFAEVLKFQESQLDDKTSFENFGVDSLVGQQIVARLEKDLADLSATVLFENITLSSLADYLTAEKSGELQSVLGLGSTEVVTSPATVAEQTNSPATNDVADTNTEGSSSADQIADEDIAIIGVTGRYPQAENLDTFWQNLANGKDCVGELPETREDWRTYVEAGYSPGPAAFLNTIDQFDPGAFNILPRDAVNIDPQERLFLETTWELLEVNGYLGEYRKEPSTGVFVGSMYTGYGQLAATRWNDGKLSGPHSAHWSLANRVSYTFDFQGPSFGVDSACSSSLTAVHLACESLRRGECKMAVAGGVNVILHPAHFESLGALNMLSAHGRSMTFDERADGFAPGEGVGAVLLKPLKQAEKDGDSILAVIKASLINAGGKTSGYTVPNPNAQSAVISGALAKAAIDPRTVTYVEAHGTGTSLGDPIEISSLNRAYKAGVGQTTDGRSKGYCSVGSVKSNVGHLEGAAGIVGLTKVLLQLKHQQLAPCVHLQNVNPKIDFENSPFVPQRELQYWPEPTIEINGVTKSYPRRAGLSSFGAGGANAHFIIEEYQTKNDIAFLSHHSGDRAQLVLLSAKTEKQLLQYAARMLNHLDTQSDSEFDLASLAYSSQLGRIEMTSRLAVQASSKQELIDALKGFQKNETAANYWHDTANTAASDVLIFNDEDGSAFTLRLLEQRKLMKLAQMWVHGVRVDWRNLWQGETVKISTFPTYPFDRRRFWLEVTAPTKDSINSSHESVLVAEQESVESLDTSVTTNIQLDTRAFYCCDHLIGAAPWLPGVTYFELIRQQAQLDLHNSRRAVIQFKNVQWLQPLNLDGHSGLLTFEKTKVNGVVSYHFYDQQSGTLLSKGRYQLLPNKFAESFNVELTKQRFDRQLSVDQFYSHMRTVGMNHKDSFQVIRSLSVNGNEALAEVSLSAENKLSLNTLQLHPALLDGALQTVAALDTTGLAFIPAGIREITCYRYLVSEVWVHVQETTQAGNSTGRRSFDINVYDEDGILIVEMKGLEIAPTFKLKRSNNSDSKQTTGVEDPSVKASLSRAEIKEKVNAELQRMASEFLMIDKADVDLTAELLDSGFDSVSMTELLEEVNSFYGVSLLPQVLFDFPTLQNFSDFMVVEHGDAVMAKHQRSAMTELKTSDISPVNSLEVSDVSSESPTWEASNAAPTQQPIHTSELQSAVDALMKDMASGFLMVSSEEVEIHADLLEIGFDSVSLAELLEEINRQLKLDLLPQVLFDCPTLADISSFLVNNNKAEVQAYESRNSKRPKAAEFQTQVANKTTSIEPSSTVNTAAVNEPVTSIEQEVVQQQAANILGVNSSEVDLQIPLYEIGFDAVLMTALADALNNILGLTVHPSLLSDQTTVAALGAYLAEARSQNTNHSPVQPMSTEHQSAASVKTNQSNQVSQDDIAIVGMSGIFPKSNNVEEFWQHLINAEDLIDSVPEDREDILQDPVSKNIKGGFVDRVADFDAKFFKISPREASSIDPQQRLFLETVWRTVEDAGYSIRELAGKEIGLFAGVGTTDYNDLMSKHHVSIEAHTATGIAHSILANRVSYLFDFRGPSEVVDTACSSALVALHRAITAITSGECEAAIAGGVNVLLGAGLFTAFTESGMLSSDFKCKTFDASANGYVRGEGVGAIMLKPLAAAKKDGDQIYAVVKGSAVNHGGRTNSLTAPSPTAQSRVITKAFKQAGIDPKTISYIEAHGTGTKLGDPIETEGLKMALQSLYKDYGYQFDGSKHVGIGSVKTNIGHLEAAAGIAGIIKVLLAMKHKTLPPSLHYEQENPFLRLNDTPLFVQNSAAEWHGVTDADNNRLLRAGVSSFGFGGTNAHVILESYQEKDETDTADPTANHLFLFSAPTGSALTQYAENIVNYLHQNSNVDLAALEATLMFGREALPHRAAVFANTKDGLVESLLALVQGQCHSRLVSKAHSEISSSNVSILHDQNILAMVSGWVNNETADWPSVGFNVVRRLNGVPSFPLTLTRYWYDDHLSVSAVPSDSTVPGVEQVGVEVNGGKPAAKNKLVLSNSFAADGEGLVSETTVTLDTAVSDVLAEQNRAINNEQSKPEVPVEENHVNSATTIGVVNSYVAATSGESDIAVSEFITSELADLLGIGEAAIEEHVEFIELGLDSIFGMQLIRKINERFSVDIPAADVYTYNTVNLLAGHIQEHADSPSHETEHHQAPIGEAESSRSQPAVELPETKVEVNEQFMCELVERAVGKSVTPADNFADTLTSFEMLQIVSELEKQFGPQKKSLLFQQHNISLLTEFISNLNVSEQTISGSLLEPEQVQALPSTLELDKKSDVTREQVVKAIEAVLEAPFDSQVAFADSLSSFDMLKVVAELEKTFGPLKKSVLFEHQNLSVLVDYLKEVSMPNQSVGTTELVEQQPGDETYLVAAKKDLGNLSELNALVEKLHQKYGKEGGLPGRDIAPYVFVGSSKEGYFNFAQNQEHMFSFSYVGSEESLPEIAREYIEYGRSQGKCANFNSLVRLEDAQGIAISATPFGVLQRFNNLKDFTLTGKPMRKLRYMVNKFSDSAGTVETKEYQVGSNPEVDLEIVQVVKNWASGKKMTNPYVYRVIDEITNGVLADGHRMFLTRLDGRLSNAIIVTKIPSENGYLLDLEFYDQKEPKGGLEFAIVEIFQKLIEEGCDMFSFGGTFGVKVCNSDNTDSVAEQELADLKELGLVNNDGNVQFKNKFRTTNSPVYLCRADEPGASSVSDILLMIANPEPLGDEFLGAEIAQLKDSKSAAQTESISSKNRSDRLLAVHHNVVKLSASDIDFDLISDSWAEQQGDFISKRMQQVRQILDSADKPKETWIPFDFVIPTASGKNAEAALCKALPKRGKKVLNNSLFPSWTYSFLDNDLVPEAINPAAGQKLFKADIDIDSLKARLNNPADVAFICLELSNNSLGGYAMSLGNLKQVKELANSAGIPLVLDATRLIENVITIKNHEAGLQEQTVWQLASKLLSMADAVTMSLSKDYGTNFGGIVATSHQKIGQYLVEKTAMRGHEVNAESRKLLNYVLSDQQFCETACQNRMLAVSDLASQLIAVGVPVIEPVSTHCLLIDVARVKNFNRSDFDSATTSQKIYTFLAWLYEHSGVRGAQHLYQAHSELETCVRLAIPVGLSTEQVRILGDCLVDCFKNAPQPELLKPIGNNLSPLDMVFEKQPTSNKGEIAETRKKSATVVDEGKNAEAEKTPDLEMIKTATNAALRPKDANYQVIHEAYPRVKRQVIKLKNSQFEVFTSGRGNPLLLMHPFNIGAGLFASQFQKLSGKFKLISIHHPGVGATTSEEKLSLETIAKQFTDILAKLKIRRPVHLVGASAGGLQAQVFAHQHPELTSSLTLICSSYKVGNRNGKVSPLAEVIEEDFVKIFEKVKDGRLVSQKQIYTEILKRCESMDPQTGLRYLDEFSNLPDLKAMLPEISVPSLVIQGKFDSVIEQETTRILHQGISGSELKTISTAGHFPTLTHADECNKLLTDFIDSVENSNNKVAESKKEDLV